MKNYSIASIKWTFFGNPMYVRIRYIRLDNNNIFLNYMSMCVQKLNTARKAIFTSKKTLQYAQRELENDFH